MVSNYVFEADAVRRRTVPAVFVHRAANTTLATK